MKSGKTKIVIIAIFLILGFTFFKIYKFFYRPYIIQTPLFNNSEEHPVFTNSEETPIRNYSPPSPTPTVYPKLGDDFKKSLILKDFPFTDSNGNQKHLVFYKSSELGQSVMANVYLTDANFNSKSAVRIPELDTAQTIIGNGFVYSDAYTLEIAVSPGPGKRLIFILGNDGSENMSNLLIDETGKVFVDWGKLYGAAIQSVESECMCDPSFDKWNDNSSIWLNVSTLKNKYKILVDLNGQVIEKNRL